MNQTDDNVVSSTTTDDNTANSSNANDVNSDSSSQEQVPFHEHPRFQELVKEKNEYKEKYEGLEARFSEIENKFKPAQPVEEENVPDPFDDPKGYAEYIKQSAIAELEAKQQASSEAERKAQELIDSQFEKLRETDKDIDEEKVSEFAMEYGITNQDKNSKLFGQYDLIKAHSLMKKIEASQATDDKERANIAPAGITSATKASSNLQGLDTRKLSTDEIIRLGLSGQLT